MSSETVNNNSNEPIKSDEDKAKANQQGSNNPPPSLAAMEVVENNHVSNVPSPALESSPTNEPNPSSASAPASAPAPVPAATDKMEMATPIASPKLSTVSVESKMQIDSSSCSSSPFSVLLSPFINKIASNSKLADSSLRHIHKTLLAVKKTPAALTNRKFRLDNVAVKKFITDIDGAVELMQAVGYQLMEKQEAGKSVKYLNMEMDVVEKNAAVLDKAIELLNDKIENPKAPATSTTATTPSSSSSSSSASSASSSTSTSSSSTSGKLVQCMAGCGFYGIPEQDYYCSVCYRKKLSMPTTSSTKAQPGKCTKLCGNFGSDKFKGMCSSCWTKHEKKVKEFKKVWKRALLKVKAMRRFLAGKKHAQLNKNRCFKCNKKIGINGFECRCQYIYCSSHRHPEDHDCTYDVKSLHRKKLAKENYTVAGSKLEKIDR